MTVSGEELFRVSPGALVTSARNDFTFVLEAHEIRHVEVHGKQCGLKNSANLSNLTGGEIFTAFDSAMVKGKRVFLIGTENGQLYTYSRNGILEKIQTLSDSPIREFVKVSTNTVFRSDTELGIASVLADRPPQSCELPPEEIE